MHWEIERIEGGHFGGFADGFSDDIIGGGAVIDGISLEDLFDGKLVGSKNDKVEASFVDSIEGKLEMPLEGCKDSMLIGLPDGEVDGTCGLFNGAKDGRFVGKIDGKVDDKIVGETDPAAQLPNCSICSKPLFSLNSGCSNTCPEKI